MTDLRINSTGMSSSWMASSTQQAAAPNQPTLPQQPLPPPRHAQQPLQPPPHAQPPHAHPPQPPPPHAHPSQPPPPHAQQQLQLPPHAQQPQPQPPHAQPGQPPPPQPPLPPPPMSILSSNPTYHQNTMMSRAPGSYQPPVPVTLPLYVHPWHAYPPPYLPPYGPLGGANGMWHPCGGTLHTNPVSPDLNSFPGLAYNTQNLLGAPLYSALRHPAAQTSGTHSCRMCNLVFPDASSRNQHEVVHFYTSTKKRPTPEAQRQRRKRQWLESTGLDRPDSVIPNQDIAPIDLSSAQVSQEKDFTPSTTLGWEQVADPSVTQNVPTTGHEEQPANLPLNVFTCFTCSCPHCGINFVLGDSLDEHMKRSHSKDDETSGAYSPSVSRAKSVLSSSAPVQKDVSAPIAVFTEAVRSHTNEYLASSRFDHETMSAEYVHHSRAFQSLHENHWPTLAPFSRPPPQRPMLAGSLPPTQVPGQLMVQSGYGRLPRPTWATYSTPSMQGSPHEAAVDLSLNSQLRRKTVPDAGCATWTDDFNVPTTTAHIGDRGARITPLSAPGDVTKHNTADFTTTSSFLGVYPTVRPINNNSYNSEKRTDLLNNLVAPYQLGLCREQSTDLPFKPPKNPCKPSEDYTVSGNGTVETTSRWDTSIASLPFGSRFRNTVAARKSLSTSVVFATGSQEGPMHKVSVNLLQGDNIATFKKDVDVSNLVIQKEVFNNDNGAESVDGNSDDDSGCSLSGDDVDLSQPDIVQASLQAAGVISQPHGVISQPHRVISQPHGVISQPHGVISQQHDVISQPHEVIPQPQRIISQQHGVISQPREVIPQPDGVISQPFYGISQPLSNGRNPDGVGKHEKDSVGKDQIRKSGHCADDLKQSHQSIEDTRQDLANDKTQDQPRRASFCCEVCGSGFYFERSLKKHMQTYHYYSEVSTPYSCSLCGMSFVLSASLGLHLQRTHGRTECADPTSVTDRGVSPIPEVDCYPHSGEGLSQHPYVQGIETDSTENGASDSNFCPQASMPCASSSKLNSIATLTQKDQPHSHDKEADEKVSWKSKTVSLVYTVNTCLICDAVFFSRATLEKHITMHVQAGGILCRLCRCPYRTYQQLNKHFIKDHYHSPDCCVECPLNEMPTACEAGKYTFFEDNEQAKRLKRECEGSVGNGEEDDDQEESRSTSLLSLGTLGHEETLSCRKNLRSFSEGISNGKQSFHQDTLSVPEARYSPHDQQSKHNMHRLPEPGPCSRFSEAHSEGMCGKTIPLTDEMSQNVLDVPVPAPLPSDTSGLRREPKGQASLYRSHHSELPTRYSVQEPFVKEALENGSCHGKRFGSVLLNKENTKCYNLSQLNEDGLVNTPVFHDPVGIYGSVPDSSRDQEIQDRVVLDNTSSARHLQQEIWDRVVLDNTSSARHLQQEIRDRVVVDNTSSARHLQQKTSLKEDQAERKEIEKPLTELFNITTLLVGNEASLEAGEKKQAKITQGDFGRGSRSILTTDWNTNKSSRDQPTWCHSDHEKMDRDGSRAVGDSQDDPGQAQNHPENDTLIHTPSLSSTHEIHLEEKPSVYPEPTIREVQTNFIPSGQSDGLVEVASDLHAVQKSLQLLDGNISDRTVEEEASVARRTTAEEVPSRQQDQQTPLLECDIVGPDDTKGDHHDQNDEREESLVELVNTEEDTGVVSELTKP